MFTLSFSRPVNKKQTKPTTTKQQHRHEKSAAIFPAPLLNVILNTKLVWLGARVTLWARCKSKAVVIDHALRTIHLRLRLFCANPYHSCCCFPHKCLWTDPSGQEFIFNLNFIDFSVWLIWLSRKLWLWAAFYFPLEK